MSKLFIFIIVAIGIFLIFRLIKEINHSRFSISSKTFDLSALKNFLANTNPNHLVFFEKKNSFFKENQSHLYGILDEIISEHPLRLLAKVPLSEIVSIDQEMNLSLQTDLYQKLDALRIDYALIDQRTSKPILMILLHNPNIKEINSHSIELMKECMQEEIKLSFYQWLCQMEIPVMLIQHQAVYDLQKIKKAIFSQLN